MSLLLLPELFQPEKPSLNRLWAVTELLEINTANPMTKGLIGLWLLNESGTRAVNLVNRSTNGVLANGAAYGVAPEGKFVSFDGTNDVIDCGLASRVEIDTSNAATVIADVRRPATTTEGTLVSKRDGGDVEFQLYVDSSDSLLWRMGGNVDTIAENIGSGRLMLAGVRQNTSITGFVNGVRQLTESTIAGSREDINLSIGARWQSYPSTGFEFNGDIHLVAIWERPLSDAEILSFYRDRFQLARSKSPGFINIGAGIVSISPTGIASAEAFGNASLSTGAISITPPSIASAEAFGAPVVSGVGVTIAPESIPSAEAFGAALVGVGAVAISPPSIDSAEAFGAAAAGPGAVLIMPGSITSEEAFGLAEVAPGGVFILPDGIATAEAFGLASLVGGAIIAPASIETLEAFGAANLSPGEVTILPIGIGSAETFGIARVGDVVIIGDGGLTRALTGNLTRNLTHPDNP